MKSSVDLLRNNHVDVASLLVNRSYATRRGIAVHVKPAAVNARILGTTLGGIQVHRVPPRADRLPSLIAIGIERPQDTPVGCPPIRAGIITLSVGVKNR